MEHLINNQETLVFHNFTSYLAKDFYVVPALIQSCIFNGISLLVCFGKGPPHIVNFIECKLGQPSMTVIS